MYYKRFGSNGRQDAREVELAVANDELEAALTTGGPIGTTGGISDGALPLLPYLDDLKLSLVPIFIG